MLNPFAADAQMLLGQRSIWAVVGQSAGPPVGSGGRAIHFSGDRSGGRTGKRVTARWASRCVRDAQRTCVHTESSEEVDFWGPEEVWRTPARPARDPEHLLPRMNPSRKHHFSPTSKQ